MKKYNYNSFVKEKKEKYFTLRAKLVGDPAKAVRRKRQGLLFINPDLAEGTNRPREENEREYLILQDKKRWEKWLQSGKLKELAPRHWRIKL